MFAWIDAQLGKLKAAGRERRILAAYPAFEKARRQEHIRASLQRFPTGELEQELHRLLANAREDVRCRFDHPIAAMEGDVTAVRQRIQTTKKELAVFKRQYRAELEPLYAELATLTAALKSLSGTKQAAYSRLERAKSDIRSWHDKSKRSGFLFGNAGAKLPKHSLFGQSFGDLDGYKVARSGAVRDIDQCNRDAVRLHARRDELYREMAAIKEARQQMFDLKRQGRSLATVHRTLAGQETALSELYSRLSAMRAERATILDAARHQTGAVEVERLILALKLKRDDFVRSFDTPQAAAARYAEHVEDWINANGS